MDSRTLQRSLAQCLLLIAVNHVVHAQQICSGRTALLVEEVTVDERPYHLVFADDFNGSALDTGQWRPAVGVMRHVEKTKYWLDPKNLEVKNGLLYIRAKRDTLLNQCFDIWIDNAMRTYCKDFFFSAGEIRTKERFSHGMFEIRCKLPRSNGLGVAFWTFGPDHNEIDVFEVYNEYDIFGKLKEKKLSSVQRTNIRTDYENDKIIEDCASRSPSRDLSSGFHVFTVEWTPQKIVWRVDGKMIRISTLFTSLDGKMLDQMIPENTVVIVNKAFPRNPMEIYVSLGFELDEEDSKDSELPVYFEVDYVRYYKR